MPQVENTPIARFYKNCADALASFELGQYGPDYTVDDLRANLSDAAKNAGVGITASSWAFSLPPLDALPAADLIDKTCALADAWIEAGRPVPTSGPVI